MSGIRMLTSVMIPRCMKVMMLSIQPSGAGGEGRVPGRMIPIPMPLNTLDAAQREILGVLLMWNTVSDVYTVPR